MAIPLGGAMVLAGQTPAPKPAPPKAAVTAAPKPAAPKLDPLVASVIELKKAGMGEELLIKGIVKEKRAVTVGVAEMKLLKAAGVSDRVIGALMDPESVAPAAAPVAAAAPAAVPASVPVTPVAAAPAAPGAPVKRRLAVEEFEFSSVATSIQAIFGTHVDIGKGIRALLTTRIQQGGKISVLERAKVNNLMKEQDFGASDRVKKGTGARIGRILGADAILMGDIVAFGRDDRDKRVGVGAATRRIPGVGGMLGGVRIGDRKAHV